MEEEEEFRENTQAGSKEKVAFGSIYRRHQLIKLGQRQAATTTTTTRMKSTTTTTKSMTKYERSHLSACTTACLRELSGCMTSEEKTFPGNSVSKRCLNSTFKRYSGGTFSTMTVYRD